MTQYNCQHTGVFFIYPITTVLISREKFSSFKGQDHETELKYLDKEGMFYVYVSKLFN
jgi:hypothetical protein